MKTKLVTSYYAHHNGPPFFGKQNRDKWYLYSIVNICNLKTEVVCYSDNRGGGLQELKKVKQKFNLDNLIIKEFDMGDNPWSSTVSEIVKLYPEKYNNINRYEYYWSSQIYWMKWFFVEKELVPNCYIYWIDGGLSHPGLFPKKYSSFYDGENWDNQFPSENFKDIEYRFYQFDKAFTPSTLNRINEFTEDKILHLSRTSGEYNVEQFYENINEEVPAQPTPFPLGGFWGGESSNLQSYVDDYYKTIEKVLSNKRYLCTDQEISYYICTKDTNSERFKYFNFDTHYHEDWEHYTPGQVSFSDIFTKL